jgi:hypothetical protein
MGVRRSFRTGQRVWVVESEVTASASPPGHTLLLSLPSAQGPPQPQREHPERRPGPGVEYPYYSPGFLGTSLRRPTALVELQREVEAIGRVVDEGGPISREELSAWSGDGAGVPVAFGARSERPCRAAGSGAPGATGSRHLSRPRSATLGTCVGSMEHV